jgi:aspartate aminotransferase, cytoplasmic
MHNSKSTAASNSSSLASNIATQRLSSIQRHMADSKQTTSFTADKVPQAPEDPLFGLMAAFRKDTFEKKVDLGIGAYRDNNAKPWVLPVVKKVKKIFVEALFAITDLLPRL